MYGYKQTGKIKWWSPPYTHTYIYSSAYNCVGGDNSLSLSLSVVDSGKFTRFEYVKHSSL